MPQDATTYDLLIIGPSDTIEYFKYILLSLLQLHFTICQNDMHQRFRIA